MGRIHPGSKSRGAVPERATRWRTTGCRTPGGGWDGGRVEAGQKPCLQVPPAWCGLELTSRGVTRAPLRGPPVGGTFSMCPIWCLRPRAHGRSLRGRRSFGAVAGMRGWSPEVAGGGGGLHPSKERKRGARGVLCCGIIVPWPPKVRCDPNPPVMGPECERIRKQRHRRLDESRWGHAGAGSLIQ